MSKMADNCQQQKTDYFYDLVQKLQDEILIQTVYSALIVVSQVSLRGFICCRCESVIDGVIDLLSN